MIRRTAAALALATLVLSARAEPAAPRGELVAIRERIAALDLEGALASIASLLERPGLPDEERVEALALRAGAHVAGGELDAAEKDYRAILALRPEFAPDPALTTKKSMERLSRAQATTVGTVHLDLDPPDAKVSVDDRLVVPSEGRIKVTAGDRRLKAERSGFDPSEVSVRAVAGAETILELHLVPNARGILVRTDVAGVEVWVDGAKAGETAATSGPAELLVPDLPIGEHAVELRKRCFATESFPALVSVDLTDRSPKALPVVALRPASARIAPTGADFPGELRVDGAKVATLPVASFSVCPGTRTLEVVASGRVVWSGSVEVDESERTLDLSPRPGVALVGDEWPAAWTDFAGATSLRGRVGLPRGQDLSTTAPWRELRWPPDTDLAVGIAPTHLPGETPRAWVYAPAMDAVAEVGAPPSTEKPRWSGPRLDAEIVEHEGALVVATVVPGGAVDRAGIASGDRIASVGGTDVATLPALTARLEALEPGAPAALRVVAPQAAARVVTVPVTSEPRLLVPEDPVDAIVRGAWAAAEGAAGGSRAASALANLALALEARGRTAPAAEAWRGAKTLAPSTFGARADYAIAVDLAARGKKAEAAELFRRVHASSGDAALAAAASDQLADLGVSAR